MEWVGREGGGICYPDWEGRDSRKMRRPRASTAVPASSLEAPETRSAETGDFQEP